MENNEKKEIEMTPELTIFFARAYAFKKNLRNAAALNPGLIYLFQELDGFLKDAPKE